MPEAVIVSAIRTPVGRAYKGSLRSTRPDGSAAEAAMKFSPAKLSGPLLMLSVLPCLKELAPWPDPNYGCAF